MGPSQKHGLLKLRFRGVNKNGGMMNKKCGQLKLASVLEFPNIIVPIHWELGHRYTDVA